MGALDGKIALVTGGTRGIGLAIVQEFIDEGAFVFFTGTTAEGVKKATGTFASPNVKGLVADVANDTDVKRVYSVIKETKGPLDVVVANAGVYKDTSVLEETPVEVVTHILNVNVTGVFLTVNRAVSGNAIKDGSSVILFSSCIGDKPNGLSSHIYSASKGAVNTLGQSLAHDLAPRKIRVNVLSPGPVATEMLLGGDSAEERTKHFSQINLAKRIGKPKEIAAATVFLASDASSYVNSTQLHVDGGF